MTKRDDFTESTKLLLAKRVGFKCSNPDCCVPTSGPAEEPEEVSNIAVAAHITAASENGPRYDKSLTEKERRDSSNAIWLCQNCAKLIDDDELRYTVEVLQSWKYFAEVRASLELGKQTDSTDVSNFQDALSKMPKLLATMARFLKDDETKLIREFYVLPSRHVEFGSNGKRRLRFLEDEYEDLRLKIDLLRDYYFIEDVSTGTLPTYRMTIQFTELLLTDHLEIDENEDVNSNDYIFTNLSDDEIELRILIECVAQHRKAEADSKLKGNKCAKELDLRKLLEDITGEKEHRLDYWLSHLAPSTKPLKGPLRRCSNSNLNKNEHKYHVRAFELSSNKEFISAWQRIDELRKKMGFRK